MFIGVVSNFSNNRIIWSNSDKVVVVIFFVGAGESVIRCRVDKKVRKN